MVVGDKVFLWYCLVNWDELKFVDFWIFDLVCNFNLYFGFGGGGVYFCLGVNLVCWEIRVVFDELCR